MVWIEIILKEKIGEQ